MPGLHFVEYVDFTFFPFAGRVIGVKVLASLRVLLVILHELCHADAFVPFSDSVVRHVFCFERSHDWFVVRTDWETIMP